MNKITLLGLGGTGANVLFDVKNYFDELNLGDQGLAKVEYHVIDTGEANKHKADAIGAGFFKIEDTKINSKNLDGCGTIRGNNVTEIKEGSNTFLNGLGLHKPDIKTFVLLVHSASGATGSVAAPIIASILLKRDINFGVLVIGDSSTLHSCANTIDTLQTYHNISKSANKNISMFFRDNAVHDDIISVNKEMISFVSTTAMFVSGQNEQLDSADMGVFFRPHMLAKKFNVPSGVSLMSQFTNATDDESYVVTRVLVNDANASVPLNTLSNRQGTIINEQLLAVVNESNIAPLVMASSIGKLSSILNRLTICKENITPMFDIDDIPVSEDEMVF